jgi:zinc transporter ZupT
MDAKTQVREWALTVLGGALLVVAVLILFLPELRTTLMRRTNELLFFTLSGIYVWQFHKSGILKLSFSQIHRMPNKPRVSVLAFAAMTASSIAMTMMTMVY